VRIDVLAHMTIEDKRRLSGTTAQLISSAAPDATGQRLAWQAGDNGAFGAMDPIARVREVVRYWLAAGHHDRAADAVLAAREHIARSGAAGEIDLCSSRSTIRRARP
jgi:hypothetical protein